MYLISSMLYGHIKLVIGIFWWLWTHPPTWDINFCFPTYPSLLLSTYNIFHVLLCLTFLLLALTSKTFVGALVYYLPHVSVKVTLLLELTLWHSSRQFEFNIFCLRMNAGLLGASNTPSLFSIEITAAIVGLSTAISCTHKSPMCMYLKMQRWWLGSCIPWSIRDKILSSLHCIQA